MKISSKFLLFYLTMTLPVTLLAQNTSPARGSATPMRPRATDRALAQRPQMGKLVAIDKDARTVIIGPVEGVPAVPTVASIETNQVFQLATNLVVIKNSKRATLNDVVVGDIARFRSRKTEDGKQTLNVLFIGMPQQPVRRTPGAPVAPAAPATK